MLIRNYMLNKNILCQSYLEDLAEAIVLFQSPTLDTNEEEPRRKEKTVKQLR